MPNNTKPYKRIYLSQLQLLVLILLFATPSFTQNYSLNGDSIKIASDIDTTYLSFDTSNQVSIPVENNQEPKIVMIKEESGIDFLNYILPIITLLLGIWLNKFLEKKSDTKRIINAGERWVVELRSLKKPIENQIEKLNEFLIEHKKEIFETPRLEVQVHLNLDIFTSLDKNELIKYIHLKHPKEKFENIVKISNQTHGYVSITRHLEYTLKEKFDQYLKQTSSYTTSLSKNLQQFQLAFADYAVELERELKSDPYTDSRFKPLADLYSHYIAPYLKGGEFNPFILDNEFFLPVLHILSDSRLDPRVKQLSLATSSALNSIKGIRMEKDYLTTNFENLIKSFEKQLAELDEVIEKVQNSNS